MAVNTELFDVVPPDTGSSIGFLAIVLLVVFGWLWAIARAAPEGRRNAALLRSSLGVGVWIGVSSGLVAAGIINPAHPVPATPLLMLAVVGGAIRLGAGRLAANAAAAVPMGLLVGFQGFRLPLELVLHHWVEIGAAPSQMTWTGQNPDIVAGVVALAAAGFAGRNRKVAIAAQVIGLVLLVNVIRVAAFSVPGPIRQFTELLLLPYNPMTVLIATVCVGGALAAHVATLRRLFRPVATESTANRA